MHVCVYLRATLNEQLIPHPGEIIVRDRITEDSNHLNKPTPKLTLYFLLRLSFNVLLVQSVSQATFPSSISGCAKHNKAIVTDSQVWEEEKHKTGLLCCTAPTNSILHSLKKRERAL